MKQETALTNFLQLLTDYKNSVDEAVTSEARQLTAETERLFTGAPVEVVSVYNEVLSRSGKRVRGALAMVAYECCGGTDNSSILRVAAVMEMLHAYMLIMDDIQDRSVTRRGGPAAHKLLEAYHIAQGYSGSPEHTGLSLGLNAFSVGAHQAMRIMASLPIEPSCLLEAIELIHRNLVLTAHGQTIDITNELRDHVGLGDAEQALLYKTAYYTFLNPLMVGAVLAGANKQQRDILQRYSLAAGKVFQLTDDIIGIYGQQTSTGKDPMDDIREGKRNILTVMALENASQPDAEFLREQLGNSALTEPNFQRVLRIIERSGAVAAVQQQIADAATAAQQSLADAKQFGCHQTQIQFLSDLVTYLTVRDK
jgi:geranylgeranyl diphosphate synthase type I